MQSLISIITPVLNAADTVQQTLDSVAKYCPPDTEHIVVDGGSTDGTLQILQQSDAILIHQDKPGLSAAMNQGLSHARGRYILLLNADDFLMPDVQGILINLPIRPADNTVYYCDILQRDEKSGLEIPCRANIDHINKYMSVYHPGLIVPRAVYDVVGLYSEEFELAMDSEWVHRCLASGISFRYVDGVSATMRLGGRSHVSLGASLAEYRRSVTQHKVTPGHIASYYFVRQLGLQTLLKFRPFRSFWLSMRGV
ncbi:MAG: glycosyltransferase [Pseudomonadota bacterium]